MKTGGSRQLVQTYQLPHRHACAYDDTLKTLEEMMKGGWKAALPE